MSNLGSAVKTGNSLEVQKELAKILKEKLKEKLKTLKEEKDEDPARREKDASIRIEQEAKARGGGDFSYKDGVALVYLRSKQAATEYSDWLEKDKDVDTYEMNIIHHKPDMDVKDDVELNDITDDRNFSFEFIVYLNPDIIVYDNDDEIEDNKNEDEDREEAEEEYKESIEFDDFLISEVKRKIKVNFTGKKRIKMVCSPGFKWDPNNSVCSKITGQELIDIRRGIRAALLTKKSEGAALKKRIIRRTKKAMKFRQLFGLVGVR